MQRLNDLGFDIGEMSIQATADGTRVSIQPKVVDAGHHQRRLLRLTGLDVEENQARRLLNDLDEFRARISRLGDDEEMVAHEWLTRVFEPVVKAIPFDLRAKLEPAEVFHQVLEHRWYMSQARGKCGAARRGAHELHRRRAPPPPRRGDADGSRRPRRCRSRSITADIPVQDDDEADERRLARPGLSDPRQYPTVKRSRECFGFSISSTTATARSGPEMYDSPSASVTTTSPPSRYEPVRSPGFQAPNPPAGWM